jgi:hypothetical protein
MGMDGLVVVQDMYSSRVGFQKDKARESGQNPTRNRLVCFKLLFFESPRRRVEGIDRLTDESHGATQTDRFAN